MSLSAVAHVFFLEEPTPKHHLAVPRRDQDDMYPFLLHCCAKQIPDRMPRQDAPTAARKALCKTQHLSNKRGRAQQCTRSSDSGLRTSQTTEQKPAKAPSCKKQQQNTAPPPRKKNKNKHKKTAPHPKRFSNLCEAHHQLPTAAGPQELQRVAQQDLSPSPSAPSAARFSRHTLATGHPQHGEVKHRPFGDSFKSFSLNKKHGEA